MVVLRLSVLLLSGVMVCYHVVQFRPVVLSSCTTSESPSLEHYAPEFLQEPLWNGCGVDNHRRKLVFVHVFKTAGSTFRTFFERYGRTCRKGVTVLIGCSGISSDYNRGEIWKSRSTRESCEVKSSWNRQNHTLTARHMKHTMNHEFLKKHETDILIGHFPMGVHTGWTEHDETLIQPTYMTFVRDPVAKYVSARLFVYQQQTQHHNLTMEQAVDRIRHDIQQRNGTQYNVYTKYLLTPEQKELHLSPTEQVDTILQNLITLPTVIGVVERMADSLRLLQHLIDPQREITKMLDAMDNTRASSHVLVRNKSKLSTRAIVAELQKDENTYRKLLDALQLERRIYEFAVQLQERQGQYLQELRQSST